MPVNKTYLIPRIMRVLALAFALLVIGAVFQFGPLKIQEARAVDTVILITDTASTTWVVPDDWNSASNTIEVIGGGGGGDGTSATGSGGGGGSAYAKSSNLTLTPAASVTIQVGAGGAGGTTAGGGTGGNTWFNSSTCAAASSCATGGAGGSGVTGGAGGATSTSVGTTLYKGGNGGVGNNTGDVGGGGGGSAGPLGSGWNGGTSSNSTADGGGGGGGGGGGSGSVGGTGTAAAGGNGGNGYNGNGGGAGCSGTCAGGNATSTAGGGGGGDNGGAGGAGATSSAWTATNGEQGGPGGGGGGCGDNGTATGGAAGNYGGGGAGCEATGGNGARGIIAITYTPAAVVSLDQKHFRWYENIDSATPTTALAALDATSTGVDASVPVRLRFNVGVTGASLGAGQGFKLQFSTTTAGGWADVGGTASSTIWRGYDNATPADGSNLPSNLIASSTVAESYEEQNVATGTPSSIAVDGFGEWDWVIQNNNASTGATYYFRKVKVTGSTPLNTYTRYPSLTTMGNVQISAATSVTHYVGQATTTISTITVTATGTDAITTYGDIVIKIASSSVNVQWDTTDTTATFGGSASGKVGAVSYPDAYTMQVAVTTDFTATDTLTIADLSFTNFNGVNTATSAHRLFRGGTNDTSSDASPSETITIKGSMALQSHPSGQEADKFGTSTSVTAAELLAFQFEPKGEAASTTMVFDLSSITGIVTEDVTNVQVVKDDNKNGNVDGAESSTFGTGTVSIAGASGSITFTTSSTVPISTTTAYILRADVANLVGGDAMTVALANTGLRAQGQSTTLRFDDTPVSFSGASQSQTHTENAISRTLRSVRWHNDDGSVSTSTAAAASETAIGARIGQRQQARFQVDNTGGPEGSGIVYRLQFATSTGGPWTDVGANTEISYSLGLAGANADSITTSTATTTPCGGCTFVNGTWHEDKATSSGNVTLVGARFTEFGFMIKNDRALAGTNYYLRLMNHASSTALDSTPTSSLALLTTTSTANDIRRFSKEAVTATPAATSQLAYFFDAVDYASGTTDDGAYATIASPAATHTPMMRFSRRAATTSDQIDVDWNGKSSVAPTGATVFLDVYRFGATNAWVNQASNNTAAADTEFTLSGSISTNLSEYYEADGSNFWTHWRVRQASSTATLSTDQPSINFLGVVTLTSATSQTFVIDDAATSIASTTISDSPSTARFTAANDIRVRIPAGLNLEWDASTTVATLGGSAASKASTTVSYENSNKTLVINVITNFAAGDTIEFSGLKYRNFTAASASSSRTLRADGASDTTDDSTDNRTLTIRGKLDAANHDVSQEDNKFIDVGSVADAELFAFKLTRTGEDMNMATITIDITATAGIASGEVTDVNLIADLDADGVIDAGEPSVATGSVSISGNSGTITFSTTWTATATRNYIVRADVASIEPGDHMRLELAASKVNARGATSQVTVPVGGSISLAGVHSRPSKAGGGAAAPGGEPPGGRTGGGVGGGGGAGEGAPPPGGGTGGGGAGGGGEGAP